MLFQERSSQFSKEKISTAMEAIMSFSEIINPEIKMNVIKSDPNEPKEKRENDPISQHLRQPLASLLADSPRSQAYLSCNLSTS